MREGIDDQCVTVGGRPGDELGTDVAVGTSAVLHDDRLAQRDTNLLANDTGDDVGGPAGGIADDKLDWLRREVLRLNTDAGQYGCANKGGECRVSDKLHFVSYQV